MKLYHLFAYAVKGKLNLEKHVFRGQTLDAPFFANTLRKGRATRLIVCCVALVAADLPFITPHSARRKAHRQLSPRQRRG